MGDQIIDSVSRIGIDKIRNNLYLKQDSRYSLEPKENGNNLMISLSEPADAGNEGNS